MEELASLAELATAPLVDVGTRVLVHEDGYVYISVGNTRPEIRDRLGWTQGNVWIPDHVESRLPVEHPEIVSPVQAMAFALMRTHHVGQEHRAGELFTRFLVTGSAAHGAGYLASRSVALVDLLVELRNTRGQVLLRGIHIAPTRHGPRGRHIWP